MCRTIVNKFDLISEFTLAIYITKFDPCKHICSKSDKKLFITYI